MGKDPGDIAGEIAELRQESDLLLDELMRRTNPSNVAKGIGSTMGSRASTLAAETQHRVGSAADDVDRLLQQASQKMPEPIRDQPYWLLAGIFGISAGLGALITSRFFRPRPKTLSERAAEGFRVGRERAAEGIGYSREQAETILQLAVDRLRSEMAAQGIVLEKRREPGMVKRVLWAGLVSIAGALGSMLFSRITERAWRSTMHEEPPRK